MLKYAETMKAEKLGSGRSKLSGPTLDQLWAKMTHIFRYRGQLRANDEIRLSREESGNSKERLEARVGIELRSIIDSRQVIDFTNR